MKGKKRLFIGMGIYAAVFLILTAAGLTFLWKYMEAYEASRPKHAVDAYLEQLTAERILQNDPELSARIDPRIQNQDTVLSFVEGLMESPLTTGRTGSGYSVRCGEDTLGSFTLREDDTGPYGLPVWTVEAESYDLSQFLRPPVSVTVPAGYHVLAGGVVLDESDIAQQDIHYEILEPFYGKYDLPVKVTYTVPAVLGEADIQVTDENGSVVPDGLDNSWISVLDNCTEAETERLNEILEVFLQRYVAFAGSRGGAERTNFYNLAQYLVPGGELFRRYQSSLEGLSYGQSVANKISKWEKNLFTRIDDTHFFCDISYQFDVTSRKGTTSTEENLKLVFTEIKGRLLVEALDNY